MPAEVVVYRTPICPYCIRAKMLLERKGVAFTEIDVTGDWDRRAWLAQVTGRRTVPQIFINGVSIGGFDDMALLERSGKLDSLLAAEPDAAQ